jgi:hypothetical protein
MASPSNIRLVATVLILATLLSGCLFGERLDIVVRNTSGADATIELVAGASDGAFATRQVPAGVDLRFQTGVPDDWSLRVDGAVVIDASSFDTAMGPILTIEISAAGVTTGNTAEG